MIEEIIVRPEITVFAIINTLVFVGIIGFSIYLAVLMIKALRAYLKQNSKGG